jgi:hypothetical protein
LTQKGAMSARSAVGWLPDAARAPVLSFDSAVAGPVVGVPNGLRIALGMAA